MMNSRFDMFLERRWLRDMEGHYDALLASPFFIRLTSQSALAIIYNTFYNVYLRPLRKYLGPWWLAESGLPYSFFIPRDTATLLAG